MFLFALFDLSAKCKNIFSLTSTFLVNFDEGDTVCLGDSLIILLTLMQFEEIEDIDF